jgi:hypothetical protein
MASYTVEDNGLRKPWDGRVWLNPPYTLALLRQFMARMAEHGEGLALVFARTETDWFFEHGWGAASGLLFIRGRLHFHVPEAPVPDHGGEHVWRPHGDAHVCALCGRAKANSGAPSVLIAYGNDDRDILAATPIDGRFVPLRLPRSYVVAALARSWVVALDEWFAALEGPASLDELDRAFATHPKARANRNWRAKIRQSLQRGEFERVEKGVWQRRATA